MQMPKLVANWTASTKVAPYVGQGYRFAAAGEAQKAIFKVRIAESGVYHLLAAYTHSQNRAEEVPFSFTTATGPEEV